MSPRRQAHASRASRRTTSMGQPRIAFSRFLIRLGGLIQTLPVAVLRPDDLIALSRSYYERGVWGQPDLVGLGLLPDETALLGETGVRGGDLLLLGVGGGREVVPLARLGFRVTGVDFVPEMVAQAQATAAQSGVPLAAYVQEISRLETPAAAYDVAWLSSRAYSCIPTRARRVGMLARIARALRPGGHFVCQFAWDSRRKLSALGSGLRRAVAWLTLGNHQAEDGDALPGGVEFLHYFTSESELRSEFLAGGFEVVHLKLQEEASNGGAVLRKRASS